MPLPDEVELPPEDGDTFEANALIKARAAREATGAAAIADDSGIEARGARRPPRGALGPLRRRGRDRRGEPRQAAARRSSGRGRSPGRLRLRARPGRRRRRRAGLRGPLRGDARRASRAAAAASATTPPSSRDDTGPDDGGRWPSSSPDEKHAISHRGRAARATGCARSGSWPEQVVIRTKPGAAAASRSSPNSLLIALKLAAGAITGSIAIRSPRRSTPLIDLVASVIAFVSVRAADEPADADHPYGHEKVESLAAAIEGMLILVGAGIIVYEATRRLVDRRRGRRPRSRDRGDRLLGRRQPRASSTYPLAAQAREHESPALEGDAAHLGTDALTSVGVLIGLRLVEITGVAALDSIAALIVAVAIVFAGIRILRRSAGVLVDEALPPRGDGPDRGGDRRRPAAGDRRLPQAPRPPRRPPPLHRPAPPVPLRAPPSSAPTRSPTAARRDRGRARRAPRS